MDSGREEAESVDRPEAIPWLRGRKPRRCDAEEKVGRVVRDGRAHWLQRARLPPIGVPAEQGPGVVPDDLHAHPVGKFLIAPVDHDALPFTPASTLLDDERNEGVGPHPFDLLARQGEGIKMVVGMGIIDGHDIGVPITRAGEMGEPIGVEQFCAFDVAERPDPHSSRSFPSSPSPRRGNISPASKHINHCAK